MYFYTLAEGIVYLVKGLYPIMNKFATLQSRYFLVIVSVELSLKANDLKLSQSS